MGDGDLSAWKQEKAAREAVAARPWWLWPFSLLWRRDAPQILDTVPEPDTVPTPVPQHVDTVPVEPWNE